MFQIVHNTFKRDIIVDNSRVVELVALCETRSDAHKYIVIFQILAHIYSRT